MSALLKIYTDAGHTTEVAHTAQNSTTTSGGTQGIGTVNLNVTSTANMPLQGIVDIDTGGNLETIAYTNAPDATHLTLAKATTISHAAGVAVVQWYYNLNIGDQTNGILNDGSQATPTGLNTGTWYLYNAGDQTALNPSLSVSSVVPPATADGVADTLVSVTSAGSGFASSVSPANLAVGAVQQFWVAEAVPLGQGNTPGAQVGVPTVIYQSV